MKILVISDIHSNAEALRAILAKEGGADAIWSAGDYTDYGPQPKEALDWIRAHGVAGVRGNHDERVMATWDAGGYDAMPPEKFAWVHYNCCHLQEEDISFLRGMPTFLSLQADGIAYLIAHRYGEGYKIIESQYHFDRFWEEHFSLPGCAAMPRRMIFGHTHRQMIMSFGGDSLWFNPGSVSYRRPDEPSKDAFYAVIRDCRIEMRHVPYDRTPLIEEAKRVRPRMSVEEWRVADFFFGWKEEDGPDLPWLAYNEERKRRRALESMKAGQGAS